jgi:hypothetical protein
MVRFFVFATHYPRRSRRLEIAQSSKRSNVLTSSTPNSFPCHTSEKSPANSNPCHTSKIAKNNPCSCHTSETTRSLLSLCALLPRAFHNSFPFKEIRTLSKNSRVYGVPFPLCELCALCRLCVNFDSFFGLSTFNCRLSTSPPVTSHQSRTITFSPEAPFRA